MTRVPNSTNCATNRLSRRDELIAGLDADLVALYERQRAHGGAGAGLATGSPVWRLPDRDRPRRAGPDLRRRRGRRAALSGVRCNPVAGQGNRRVKVIVEADGGSRGNPGPAGYGSVVWSADRERGARREQAGDRPRHQQRRRVQRADRRAGGGGPARRHRGRRLHGLQACGGTDVGPLAGQASRPGAAASTGHSRCRRGSTASPTRGFRGPRTATPTGWPTRRWTPRPNSRLPPKNRSRKRRHRRGGPAPVARRPGSCCCGTGRPNCPWTVGIRVAAIRR